MPCYDPGANEESDRRQVEKINKLTRMLCFCCDILDRRAGGQEIYENNELRAWWDEHRHADAERIDAVKRAAGVKAAKLMTARSIREHGIKLHAVDGDADIPEVQQYLNQVAKDVADQLTREATG